MNIPQSKIENFVAVFNNYSIDIKKAIVDLKKIRRIYTSFFLKFHAKYRYMWE